jgi:RHS repeat-associated protein
MWNNCTYIYSWDTAIEEYTTTANTLTTTREYTLTPNVEDDIVHMRLTPYSGWVATTSQDSYYEKDHLWSIIRITDKDQNIIDEYTYSLFGQPYRKTQSGTFEPINTTNNSPIWNTRLYTGREYDVETGLAYHRARYYDPGMGRFLSPDPIWTADDINLYRYVANSPVMYVDPNGTVKIVVKETATRLLSWTADALTLALGIDITNAPWVLTYDTDMARWRTLQDAVVNPTGWATAISIILPIPGWKKEATEKAIAEITQKFWNLKCTECANEVIQYLKKNAINGQKIEVQFNGNHIISDVWWEISQNGYHEAVKIWDKVFDNIHKNWIWLDDWYKDLWISEFPKKFDVRFKDF